MVLRGVSLALSSLVLALPLASEAQAAVSAQPDAAQVAAAMTEGTATVVTGASWGVRPPSNSPSATSDAPVLGLPSAGSQFAILSTGAADSLLAGPQTYSATTDNGGGARAGGTDRDAIVLKIDVKVPQGANCMSFAFRFASDEYPEYVGASYNDGFIAELDNTSWTTSASSISAPGNFAFDPAGAVVSVNATGATTVKAEEAAGTIYDGGTPILYAATPVTPGSHSLYLSLFDQGDAKLDSAVLLDNLVVGATAADTCKGGATVAPPPTSAPAAAAPSIFGPAGIVAAPANKKCISKRNFRIRIRKRAGLTYIAAFVWVNGKRVATRRGSRITAPINLRGLPKGRYAVKIRVVTSTGQVINGTRRYRTCAKKQSSTGKRPL